MQILYLIPARGGSKGLLRKNIKPLNNKPLLAYAVEAAKKSNYPGRVIVSTEDEEIAEIVKKYNVEVVDRPDEYATDTAPMIDVLIDCIDKLKKDGYYPDVVVVLQPTAPLRTSEDVSNAIKKFLDSGADSCVSVCKQEHSPEQALLLTDKDIIIPLLGWQKFYKRRQDLSSTYMPNGAVYVVNTDRAIKERKFYFENSTVAYKMPHERSVDIDSADDFKFAEFLLRGASED